MGKDAGGGVTQGSPLDQVAVAAFINLRGATSGTDVNFTRFRLPSSMRPAKSWNLVLRRPAGKIF